MSRTALTFTEETNSGVKIINLDGKIMGDTDTKKMCSHIAELRDDGWKFFVLNFRNVKWINSLGLGSIMGCLTSIRKSGGDLCIANVHDAALKYFEMTKLNRVIQIYPMISVAVKKLTQQEKK